MAFQSTQHTLQQPPGPSNSALPNEVWRTVFSHLPNPVDKNEQWEPLNLDTERDRLVLEPILVLRQVCRVFRAIINDLPFWLAAEFDLVSLISNCEGDHGPLEFRFVKALLTDGDLLETFQKKTSWTFCRFSVFRIVSETVPNHRENVTELAFVGRPKGKRFDQLGAPREWVDGVLICYPKLQSLTIETVELSLISEKCRELSVLRISSPPVRSLLDCSLNQFCNLRELVLDGIDSYVLPISSTETLEVLKLRRIATTIPHWDFNSLHLFKSLSSLSISPCKELVFDAIIGGSFNLTALDVVILRDAVPLNKIVAMVSSPAVKEMKEFKFELGDNRWQQFPEWTEETYARFLLGISSNCHSLNTIDLSMPFRRVCFRHLGRLVNLKKVSWRGRLLDVQDTGNYAVSEGIAQTAVEHAFVEFETKPVCETMVFKHSERPPRNYQWQSAQWRAPSSYGVNPMRSARNGKC
jgi:hypothetical protein